MADSVRAIGSRLELLVDDWLIDGMEGVSLKLHSPVPREVALEFNRAWEGTVSYDPVIILEEGRYRLWYRACGPVWGDQRTGCAISAQLTRRRFPAAAQGQPVSTWENRRISGSLQGSTTSPIPL